MVAAGAGLSLNVDTRRAAVEAALAARAGLSGVSPSLAVLFACALPAVSGLRIRPAHAGNVLVAHASLHVDGRDPNHARSFLPLPKYGGKLKHITNR
jgi:hypothetical protein